MPKCSCGAAAVLTLLAASSPANAETLEFVFKKPSDAKGWSAATQEWVVKKSGYTPIIENKNEPVQPVAVYKGEFGDVVVSTGLKINPNNTFGGGPFIWTSVAEERTKLLLDYMAETYKEIPA